MPDIYEIKGPDGKMLEIESDHTPTKEEVAKALSAVYKVSWSDEHPYIKAATDLMVGVAKGVAHTAIDLGQAVHQIPGVSRAVDTLYRTPGLSKEVFPQARQDTAYTNATQMAGGALETAVEMAVPVGRAVKAIPTAARAGAKFKDVMSAAHSVSIDVNEAGKVALRIQQLAERGGTMPTAVRKFLQRVTSPDLPPMAYEEARDFASNISRLSADEAGRLTPVIGREVANLRVALSKANAEAAKAAGKGKEYIQAMSEYARAMKIRAATDSIFQSIKRVAPYASVGGGSYYLTKKIQELLTD